MLRRIIPIKSIAWGTMLLRAGLFYRLAEDVAEAIVAAGLAYFEGDDPPFAEEDLKQFEQETDRQAKLEQEHAKLVRVRAERKAAEDRQIAEDYERIKAQTAERRKARKARQ